MITFYKLSSGDSCFIDYSRNSLKYTFSKIESEYCEYVAGDTRKYKECFKILDSKEEYRIDLLELTECKDKKTINIILTRYLDNTPNCINTKKPSLYSELGLVEYQKKYRIDNKEKKSLNDKSIFKCSCGSDITNGHLSRHNTTKKHLNYLLRLPVV